MMDFGLTAWWTIGVGVVVNSACAILGCFLVLRRMSMLGDAISHAVLPGLVLAYLFAGRTSIMPLFAGAMATGILTALLVQTLNRFGGVAEDAALGIVFTSLFAIGVLLISNFASQVHIDVNCVLLGDLDTVPLLRTNWYGLQVPRVFPRMLIALAAVVLFVALFWKELKIASFDPALATAMGLSAVLIHYLLMGMTAVVSVAAFEAVGSVISVAMLIVPAATAQLLTDRLNRMILLSIVIAVVSSVVGFLLARTFKANAAGMMGVAAGLQFAAAVVFAPRYGLLSKAWHALVLATRIAAEDLAALLYRADEIRPSGAVAGLTAGEMTETLGRGFVVRLALQRLRRRGWVQQPDGRRYTLSSTGRRKAESLVRTHRLWEAYLMEHFHLPLDHVHAPAERIEHFIGPELQQRLADSVAESALDPHGREIPKSTE